ncbi:hypothetical protein PanWU01x14_177990, partial [Parasponia andersonii]
ENKADDTLSCVNTIIHSMYNTIVGFERLKDEYFQCSNFEIIYQETLENSTPTHTDMLIRDGYLFKGVKLCNPRISLRDFLVWELFARGLTRHFGRNKSIILVEDRFYWPSLK